jgi:26S proteasome regulatory subunit N8
MLVSLSINKVPFEEDEKDPLVWFADHNYHEDMYSMFRKVNGMNFLNQQKK